MPPVYPTEQQATIDLLNKSALEYLQSWIDIAGGDRSETAIDAKIKAQIPYFQLLHADKRALGGVKLHMLYVKLEIVGFWMSSVWRDVDYTEDIQESKNQFTAHLEKIQASLESDIMTLEKSRAVSGGVRTGTITPTPTMPVPVPPRTRIDPSDPRYGGDARPGFDPFRFR